MMKQDNNTAHLLLTFDYELFLGPDSGTPEKCLIEPTEALLHVLNKHHAKSIFFVDSLYLYRLKSEGLSKEHALVCSQIKKISDDGHDVFLHVHPHWLDAVYQKTNATWDLSNIKRYAFSALSDEEVNFVFEQAFLELCEALQSDGKEIRGYRAGGLFVQPFPRLDRVLRKLNIRNEFSAFPGFRSNAGGFLTDFSDLKVPLCYQFTEDISIPEPEGYYTEYTINRFTFSGTDRWINSVVFRLNQNNRQWMPWGNGKGATAIIANNHARKGLFSEVAESYSVELMNRWKTRLYLKDLKKKRFLHFLSHPKLISPGNLICLDHFLNKAMGGGQCNVDFRKIPVPLQPC
jgi:hypothetical protein